MSEWSQAPLTRGIEKRNTRPEGVWNRVSVIYLEPWLPLVFSSLLHLGEAGRPRRIRVGHVRQEAYLVEAGVGSQPREAGLHLGHKRGGRKCTLGRQGGVHGFGSEGVQTKHGARALSRLLFALGLPIPSWTDRPSWAARLHAPGASWCGYGQWGCCLAWFGFSQSRCALAPSWALATRGQEVQPAGPRRWSCWVCKS